MVVGRSNECDITLSTAHLSRRHAKLFVDNGLLYVKDLESSNGTYLNGKRITEARVMRGDELRFDALSFGIIGPTDDIDKTTLRARNADT
jgi:pSer/pThr/pTyr-binding forkhead associated (FHA) protein